MNHTSISDLKAKAKDQLLGNYGIATGSFALLFVLVYLLMSVIMGALMAGIQPGAGAAMPQGFAYQIKTQILGMVVGALSATVAVGHIYILKRIVDGEKPVMSDLFFVFKNHPDKVLIIALIMTVAQFILLLPSTIIGASTTDGKRFLLYIVLYLTGFVISFMIDLMLSMSYMIYLDDPDTPVGDIIKGSISMMKGNKFRYFYMILSFIGYWLLIFISCGIAALWVIPYQNMVTVEFYYDLCKDRKISDNESGI